MSNDIWRREFFHKFGMLTGQTNPTFMTAQFRGFSAFAWLPMFWPKIYDFPVTSDDVILATFPKSGTTWTQQILYLLLTGDFEGAKNVLMPIRSPCIEFTVPPCPEALDAFAARPSPRIIKTHCPSELLPKDAARAKMIYLYRNPRDTVVSYYHFARFLQYDNAPFMPFNEYVKAFMNNEVAWTPYPAHLKSYLDYKKAGHPILIIRYEDIKKDVRGWIRRLADFVGKSAELTDELLERIYEATTLKAMQEAATNQVRVVADETGEAESRQFIRKGIVGDWKSHFAPYPELLKEFDQWILDNVPAEMLQTFEYETSN